MVDASGTNAYTYTSGGLLATEDGPWASDTVTNTYFNRMRTNLSLAQTIAEALTIEWLSHHFYFRSGNRDLIWLPEHASIRN